MPRRLLKKTRRVRRPRPAKLGEAMRRLDGRHWTGLGTVMDKQGGQHWDDHDGQDITVDVELHPSGVVITCRVCGFSGGADRGAWGIPEPGEEVAVLVPDGEPDAGGLIVGTASSGAVPAALARSTYVVRAPTVIIQGATEVHVQGGRVVVESGDVQLGADGLVAAQAGVVLGECPDPFTGATHFALGGASSVVKARKV